MFVTSKKVTIEVTKITPSIVFYFNTKKGKRYGKERSMIAYAFEGFLYSTRRFLKYEEDGKFRWSTRPIEEL